MKKIETKHFKYKDIIRSYTADKLNIDNNIPLIYKDNYIKLLGYLQELRDAYGKPIIVNSGYRSEELNKAVGGSRISSHLYCLAADIRTNDLNEFIPFVRDFYKDRSDYDQVIIESNSRGSKWIHIGIEHPKYGRRGQLFNMDVI